MSFINSKLIGSQVDATEYHGQKIPRGMHAYPMSPSALKEFGRCPNRWLHGYQSPESEAKDWGSLLDCLVLTPGLFESRYIIEPATYVNEKGETKKWSNNAKACKDWHDQQAGKEVVKAGDIESVKAARERLLSDDVIKAFLDASDKQVMVEAQWEDEATGLTIPVRCLIDLVPKTDSEYGRCLGDLKSARDASVETFNDDGFKLGYPLQAAFDLDIYNAATGENRNTWFFACQESYPPYQPAVHIYDCDGTQPGNAIVTGRVWYKWLLKQYCKALKTGKWDGYKGAITTQGCNVLRLKPWQEEKIMLLVADGEYAQPTKEPKTETTEENCDTMP